MDECEPIEESKEESNVPGTDSHLVPGTFAITYHSEVSATTANASQAYGTMTEEVPDGPTIVMPVRDNEAGTYSLTATDAGTFLEKTDLESGPLVSTRQGRATVTQGEEKRGRKRKGVRTIY